MISEMIDDTLGKQSRPLTERKLAFVSGGFLQTANAYSKKEMPIVEKQKLAATPQELISEAEICSFLQSNNKSKQGLRTVGSGLENMGNTCFLNTALQCLIHTLPLCLYLNSQKHSKQCATIKGRTDSFCALCSMEKLALLSRGQAKGDGRKAITPKEIIYNIKSIGKQFKMNRQEDCHEFMRCIVDAMQMGAIGFNRKMPRPLQETSAIFQIFGGKLQSKVVCDQCKKDSTIIESFLDLSLELKNSNSIDQCLDQFFRVDHLTSKNHYSCSFCKKLTEASKQFSIDTCKFFDNIL